jgi:hypothetical protein
MGNRRIPAVAGILMLTAGAFNIIWLAAAFTRIIDFKEILCVMWVISPLPYFGVAAGFGGSTAASNTLAAIFVLRILASIMGSTFVLKRRMWGLALSGSIGALLCFPILGIAAIIVTVMSKHWYLGQENQ